MKHFLYLWILITFVFGFFFPLPSIDSCYGTMCISEIGYPIFSFTPNYIQPTCDGICSLEELKHIEFSLDHFTLDLVYGFLITIVISIVFLIGKRVFR